MAFWQRFPPHTMTESEERLIAKVREIKTQEEMEATCKPGGCRHCFYPLEGHPRQFTHTICYPGRYMAMICLHRKFIYVYGDPRLPKKDNRGRSIHWRG
jgi:hypothetical protein